MKTHDNAGEKAPFYHYRDYKGREADLVFIKNGAIYAVECKFAIKHSLSEVSGFTGLDESKHEKGVRCILCGAEELSALSKDILVAPIKSV